MRISLVLYSSSKADSAVLARSPGRYLFFNMSCSFEWIQTCVFAGNRHGDQKWCCSGPVLRVMTIRFYRHQMIVEPLVLITSGPPFYLYTSKVMLKKRWFREKGGGARRRQKSWISGGESRVRGIYKLSSTDGFYDIVWQSWWQQLTASLP